MSEDDRKQSNYTTRSRQTGALDETTGYCFYTGKGHSGPLAHRAEALELGRRRFRPPITDLDYLVDRHRTAHLKQWISELDRPPYWVLDVGGRIQPYSILFPKDCEYISLDLVLEGLVNVIGTAQQLPFPDGAIDCVMCTQVLSYVPDPQAAVDEYYRVLRPLGALILTAPAFFPKHHDELWRFTDAGLSELTKAFVSVKVRPEGNSAAGLARSLNHSLHAQIRSSRLNRLAAHTTIPLINLLGKLLDQILPANTCCTANYSLLAIKPPNTTSPPRIQH